MKSIIVAGLAGVLVSILMFALSLSAVAYIAGGIIAFIGIYVAASVLGSAGPNLTHNVATAAVQDARARLNSIRFSAVQTSSGELIEAVAELNAGFEEVFLQIEGHRGGYARVGLSLALLKPLTEAAEVCALHRDGPKFPELVGKLKATFAEALRELKENAEGLTEEDLRAFENRCDTVKVIAARN